MTQDEITQYVASRLYPGVRLKVTVLPLADCSFDFCHIIVQTEAGLAYEILRFHHEIHPVLIEHFLAEFRSVLKNKGLDL